MTRLLAALPLLILSGAVFGQTFECRDSWRAIFDENAPVLVVATINKDERTGKIKVAGKSFETQYELEGLDHRWDWGSNEEDDGYNYAFVIQPDGDGAYFNFGYEDLTTADQVFTCRQQEIEALQRAISEEDEPMQALNSNEMEAYQFALQQKIQRNWVQPSSALPGIECVIDVRQLPGGDVVSATVGRCNGDDAVRRSIEAAVFKASPLPEPDDPNLFHRDLRITFKPEE